MVGIKTKERAVLDETRNGQGLWSTEFRLYFLLSTPAT